jgi:type II secretory pathway pseudopilin PulG
VAMPLVFAPLLLQVSTSFELAFFQSHLPLRMGLDQAHLNTMKNFKHNGFITFQMLIIIVIVLLSLIAILVAFFSARSLSRDNQRLVDVTVMQQALQIYYTDNGYYPAGEQTSDPVGLEHIIDTWPKSPEADGRCSKSQNDYKYSQKLSGSDYELTFCLGSKTKGLAAGLHTATSKEIK